MLTSAWPIVAPTYHPVSVFDCAKLAEDATTPESAIAVAMVNFLRDIFSPCC
jgi:hypothetical protein